jgi:hypothetical protein
MLALLGQHCSITLSGHAAMHDYKLACTNSRLSCPTSYVIHPRESRAQGLANLYGLLTLLTWRIRHRRGAVMPLQWAVSGFAGLFESRSIRLRQWISGGFRAKNLDRGRSKCRFARAKRLIARCDRFIDSSNCRPHICAHDDGLHILQHATSTFVSDHAAATMNLCSSRFSVHAA